MRSLKPEGVAGPFEDIPALIIVVIGIMIFFASAINSFASYYERHNIQDPEEICWNILKSVRNYDRFLVDGGNDGDFSYNKLYHFLCLIFHKAVKI